MATELTQKYLTEKAKLNPEQRRAVETTEGPIMVLAGPGTGKTQVLAFRIAEILLQTDSAPRNILALTFTESGVVAMRERLASLIGTTAYGVGIYTFHSFANRIINESGAEFYRSHALEQIDDITQLRLVMELIDHYEGELLKPARAPYFYVKPIISSIKSLKNEGVSPDLLRQLSHEEITALENNPESLSKSGKSKGQLKQAVKDHILRLQKSIDLADIYEKYEAELAERGLYDYEDMILFVLRSLQNNPELKARYQEQFHYILVDEYQDTNSAQNELIRLLGDYFDNPNICVVGDDKQSIYRFQGASMANLLSFRDWYSSVTTISLKENYRSGQIILDNAHALIERNKDQLTHILDDITAELNAQDKAGKVQFISFASPDTEALWFAKEVRRLLDSGVPASEIAVIYRENSQAQLFTDLLTREGIAFTLESGTDVLRDNDVRQLISLLKLTANPLDDNALFHYLHAPYSGVGSATLVAFGQWCKRERLRWGEVLRKEERPEPVSGEEWGNLITLRERINEWYRLAASQSLGEVVEYVLRDSGLLKHIMEQVDHIERLHRVRCFFDDVKRLVATSPYATLSELFDRITVRQTYNINLVSRPFIEENVGAIRLMTAHKSKGLEFEYVFMPDCIDSRWGGAKKSQLITLPAGIVGHHQVSVDQEVEEQRRLFYVALTRAKKQVIISYAEADAEGKKQMVCQFISELPQAEVVTSTLSQKQLAVTAFFSPVSSRFVTEQNQAYLRDIVSKQAITPTGLNTYRTCPMEYLYRNVYCIPGVREPDQGYGTAIHKALEYWGRMSQSNSVVTLPEILSIFQEALVREALNDRDAARYRRLGEEVLTAYFESHRDTWAPPLAMEYSFSPHNVLLDGAIPITGKLDKIEPISGSKHVRVVDYKTGRVRSRNEIEGNTSSSDRDYKYQLIFYTILAEADPFFPYTIGEAALAFVDDDKRFTVESFTITQEEKEEVREAIRWMHNEMQQLHFEHTPHKKRYGKGESLCDLLRSDLEAPTVEPLPKAIEPAVQESLI